MSITYEIYLKTLSKSVVKRALDILYEHGIQLEIDPSFDFLSNDEGYMPIMLNIQCLPGWIYNNKKILSGFEIYVENVASESTEGQAGYCKLVILSLSLTSPANSFIGECFGIALSEAGKGFIINGESGKRISGSMKEIIPSSSMILALNNEENLNAETFTSW